MLRGRNSQALRGFLGLIVAGLAIASAPAGADAAFPGMNGRIAYEGGSSASAIFSMNPDGTGKQDLTGPPLVTLRGTAAGGYEPSYSADGKRIVFELVRQGARPDVAVMNADGTGQKDLTPNTGTDDEEQPSFSPDGSKIAYTRAPDGGTQAIYVMNADGSSPTDLTSSLPITFPGSPEYSPDGSKIAFDATSGTDRDIYVMNANGTGLTNITSAVADNSRFASWSPDGSRIAFRHVDATNRSDIYVIGSSGGATTNLTSALVGTEVSSPVFSPDGTRIAYGRVEGTDADIFTMGSADGLGQTNLTTDVTGSTGRPSWGPVVVDTDAPAVTISKGPGKRTSKRIARLEFSAEEAGITFQCKLSGKGVKRGPRKFKACTSPKVYRRLKPGKKKFQVRATDGAGNVGIAKLAWKIKAGS